MASTISVTVWGKGNRYHGSEGLTHWAVAVHQKGSTIGYIYHLTSRGKWRYVKENSDQKLVSVTAWGRSELAQISSTDSTRAHTVLGTYGNNFNKVMETHGFDATGAPKIHVGNCQNFVVGALEALESSGLVPKGSAEFWDCQRGKDSPEVVTAVAGTGQKWVAGPAAEHAATASASSVADATYGREEPQRTVAKADLSKFGGLTKSLGATMSSKKGK